jgi:uncharacterized membrane protein
LERQADDKEGKMSSSPILFLHICSGTIGVLSGAAAVSFRKGSPRHRTAGNVFVIAMVNLGTTAVYLALMKSQMTNVFGGVLTFYLAVTSWMTVRRRESKPGIFDWIALLAALTVGAVIVTYGFQAAHSPRGLKAGVPAGMYFFLGSIALLAAVGDVRILVRGGIFGTQRLVRHLWRMCFALFIASASIFIARPHLFPALFRKTGLLFLLGIGPLILMIFWLVRVRFAKAYKGKSMPGRSDVYPLPPQLSTTAFHEIHSTSAT